jgi:hypothetical protein
MRTADAIVNGTGSRLVSGTTLQIRTNRLAPITVPSLGGPAAARHSAANMPDKIPVTEMPAPGPGLGIVTAKMRI